MTVIISHTSGDGIRKQRLADLLARSFGPGIIERQVRLPGSF